jgi:hypothetical protein
MSQRCCAATTASFSGGPNLEASLKANLRALEWQPYKLYVLREEPNKKKAAWSNESQEISYLEWNPDEEVECWDKVMLM